MSKQDQSCKTPRWLLLKSHLNNLSPEAFKSMIANAQEKAIVIDVRTPGEFAMGQISNAINLDYLHENFWDEIEQLDTNNTLFFVYCRTGRRSIRACTLMRNGGFDQDKIFNLDGGFEAWKMTFSSEIS